MVMRSCRDRLPSIQPAEYHTVLVDMDTPRPHKVLSARKLRGVQTPVFPGASSGAARSKIESSR